MSKDRVEAARSEIHVKAHEDFIARYFKIENGERVEDSALNALLEAVGSMRQAAEKSHDATIAIMKNPMQTPMANHREAQKIGHQLWEAASKKIDAACQAALREVERLEKDISAPPPIKDPALASEIRAALARLDQNARGKAIHEATEAGDDEIMSAVLRAPAMLSGLTTAELEMRRAHWQKTRRPSETDRVNRLKKAIADSCDCSRRSRDFIFELTDSDAIRRAEEAERAASVAKMAVIATRGFKCN